jgi:hypothetical protein
MARKNKTQTPCTCSKYVINEWNETKQDWDEIASTGCPGTLTTREFAPGHDAKLKGFLIRAGLAYQEVSDDQGITASAEQMAKRFGFAHLVLQGIENGKFERAEKADNKKKRAYKAERRNDKANEKAVDYRYVGGVHDGNQARKSRELAALVAAEEAKHAAEQAIERPEPEWDDEPQIVTAKVGRWTYEGTVEDGTFHYMAKGEPKTATKFTLV